MGVCMPGDVVLMVGSLDVFVCECIHVCMWMFGTMASCPTHPCYTVDTMKGLWSFTLQRVNFDVCSVHSFCNQFYAVSRSSWSRNSHNPAASTACWTAWQLWDRREWAVGETAEDGAGGGTGSRGGLIYPHYQLGTASGCWLQQVQYSTVLWPCLCCPSVFMSTTMWKSYTILCIFPISISIYSIVGISLICRHNKLCVDEMDAAGRETLKQVEGVSTFVPVCSHPLDGHHVSQVALGPNHSLFLTGWHWCVCSLLLCHWE